MTKKQAEKILNDPNACLEDQVKAYIKAKPQWGYKECIAFCQMTLCKLDPGHESYYHWSLQLVKEIRANQQAIEAEGQADKVEIHNHVYKPG